MLDKEEEDNSEKEEDCVIIDVKIPIFNIAFADSSSNARSSPLIKFFFYRILFLLYDILSSCLSLWCFFFVLLYKLNNPNNYRFNDCIYNRNNCLKNWNYNYNCDEYINCRGYYRDEFLTVNIGREGEKKKTNSTRVVIMMIIIVLL